MTRNEVEAAYFTLLRAREELFALRRWEEYLGDEVRRIRRFVSEGAALEDTVDRRLRRALRHTDVRYSLEADVDMPVPGFLKKRATRTILDQGLRGLKQRAEARV